VLLVDEHDVTHHALELIHTDNGWLVSTVEGSATEYSGAPPSRGPYRSRHG
jgi:hypothetical protein